MFRFTPFKTYCDKKYFFIVHRRRFWISLIGRGCDHCRQQVALRTDLSRFALPYGIFSILGKHGGQRIKVLRRVIQNGIFKVQNLISEQRLAGEEHLPVLLELGCDVC